MTITVPITVPRKSGQIKEVHDADWVQLTVSGPGPQPFLKSDFPGSAGIPAGDLESRAMQWTLASPKTRGKHQRKMCETLVCKSDLHTPIRTMPNTTQRANRSPAGMPALPGRGVLQKRCVAPMRIVRISDFSGSSRNRNRNRNPIPGSPRARGNRSWR